MLSALARRDVLADRTALAGCALAVLGAALATSPSRALARETEGAIAGMALLAFLVLCLFSIVELLDRWSKLELEWTRKVAHVGVGLIALLAPALFRTPWPMLVLTASFAIVLLASRRIGVLEPLHPRGRRGAGDLTYAAGVYVAFALADDAASFQLAVLVLALADPAAALIGRAAGRRRFHMLGTSRTFEGTLAFVLVALVVGGVFAAVAGLAPAMIVALALVTAAAEAVSPPGLDNLTIPLAAVFVLRLL